MTAFLEERPHAGPGPGRRAAPAPTGESRATCVAGGRSRLMCGALAVGLFAGLSAPLLALAGAPAWAALAAPLVLTTALVDLARSLHQIFGRASALPEGVPSMQDLIVAVPIILRGTADVAAIGNFLRRNRVALSANRTPVAFLADGPDGSIAKSGDETGIRQAAIEAVRKGQIQAPDLQISLYWRPKGVDHWGRRVGLERKRGKVLAFLSQLDGAAPALTHIAGVGVTKAIPFVFVADVDTTLPTGTLRRLMAKAAHPDAAEAAIITPRITSARSQRRSWFASGLFGNGETDIEPTPRPSLRQDVTGEDLFFGKGLVRVGPFLERLKGRLPQDLVLSHDHIEGMIVGSLHASDAPVLESVPQTMGQWLGRQHRWVRGDTQNLAFVLPRAWVTRPPRGDRLAVLDRVELVHNVVGHLTPAAILIVLTSLMDDPNSSTAVWGLALVLVLGVGAGVVARAAGVLCPPPPERSRKKAFGDLRQSLAASAVRFSMTPAMAVIGLHAVLRGFRAVLFDPRDALDWPGGGPERSVTWALVGATAGGLLFLMAAPASLPFVALIAAGWIVAPLIFSRLAPGYGEAHDRL